MILFLVVFYLQQHFWTTWTTWTTSKSVKKNIIFLLILNDNYIFIIKNKKYKKNIFIFSDFNVVHLVHPVQKKLSYLNSRRKGENLDK